MASFDAAGINAASLARAAIAYAQAGIPVFPLVPGGKQPLVPQGFYQATTDLERIARWWQAHPQANIGVACGAPSDWWVLDIDPRHGGWEALQRLQ
ncbi:MAG TPA: bifunctional DNA primase/polymerase, partial [Ktedonobacteraceae bacterium]|nr:bifunctional DNA primase/polymerase [Ktedonobacteraceae bacterium]